MVNFDVSCIETSFDTWYDSVASTYSTQPSNLRARANITSQLVDLHREGAGISKVYEDTLRSMINIFGNFYYTNGDGELIKVKSIYANPERSVAKQFQEGNIIIPIISVSQIKTDDSDTERQRYHNQLVVETIWNDKIQRAQRIVSFMPRPIDITYTVYIWTEYREDIDQVISQIRGAFNPSMNIPTAANDITKAFIMAEDNISLLDVADREDRLLRSSFDIRVETYITTPKYLVTNSGKIEKFNVEYEYYKEDNLIPK